MSLKQKKTAWSLSFIVLCVAVVMAPRCHAYPPQAQHYAVGDGTVIGIDIGSANSRVGIISNDILDILDQIPSCVAFTDQGILIGSKAQEEIYKHASQTICNVRALLGRDWSDPVLQDTIKTLPYRVKEEGGEPVISVEMQGKEHTFTPEHIAGMVMGNLRDTAAKLIDDDVRHAVVAVPTGFNVQQRQAIKDAGTTVGLNVLRTVNESTAAAMAYELDRPDHEQNVVVLDMGASKTDVTVLNIDQGVFEVFATASVPMGGDWFNRRFAQHIAAQCLREGISGVDEQALGQEMETAKTRWATEPLDYCKQIDCWKQCPGLGNRVSKQLSQDLNRELSTAVFDALKQALDDSSMKLKWEEGSTITKMAGVTSIPSNISDVESFIVVGGFSKLRLVKWMMQGLTWNNPWTYKDFDADEAVLKGVALIAHIFSGDDGTHYQTIPDVTPLSLGVETSEGYMRKIIQRNTPVPTRKTQNFTTAYVDQDSIIIRVFEGEHMMAKDNWLLGEFELAGIPRAPQGEPRIEVSFEVDADSNLRATAHYPDNTASSLINSRNDYSSSIAWDEIDRIVSEAEQQLEKEIPVGTATATLERYIEIVERAMDRKDVVDIPGSNDDLKKEARNVVQVTRKWISHKSAAASMEDFRSKEADLLEIAQSLASFDPVGRIYSLGGKNLPVGRGQHDEL